jgi:hypothetical protein
MKCMRLWKRGYRHQRVPRRSSSADRRPHTGPRQRTCERVHVLPHPSYHIRARSLRQRQRSYGAPGKRRQKRKRRSARQRRRTSRGSALHGASGGGARTYVSERTVSRQMQHSRRRRESRSKRRRKKGRRQNGDASARKRTQERGAAHRRPGVKQGATGRGGQ